jgi:hypothetical protein
MPSVNKWGANFGRRIAEHARAGDLGENAGRAIGNAVPKAAKAIPTVGNALNKAGANFGRRMAEHGRNGDFGGNAGKAVGNTAKGLGKFIGKNALRLVPGGAFVVAANDNRKIVIFVIIAVVILFAYLVFQLSGGLLNPPPSSSQTSSTNPLQVFVQCNPSGTKDSPLPVGSTSVCTIMVTDTESPDNITTVATIASFAQYVPNSATYNGASGGTYDPANGTVTWDAQKLGIPLTSPSFTLTLTVKLIKPYNGTQNAEGGPISIIATPLGGTASANHDTCGGTYKLNNPIGNFGDPLCNFTKDQLSNLIQQQDPNHYNAWFKIIIPAETGGTFDPNSYNPNSTSALNGGTPGAFGLYQMNEAGKGNGQYDNGSVEWKQQTTNAIQYNNTVLIPKGCDFRYWSTAINAGISKGSC